MMPVWRSPTAKTVQNLIEDIRAIRSQVDWIVVNYRWGDAFRD